MQDQDENQINFVKIQMDRLARTIENLGGNLKQRGEEI